MQYSNRNREEFLLYGWSEMNYLIKNCVKETRKNRFVATITSYQMIVRKKASKHPQSNNNSHAQHNDVSVKIIIL